ncbi:MAG: 50S ribosomal protein L9 [Acidobacteria bacterium]|nr:50S ribosomal protein L9 [Acidobacteriota bacterium]
MKLILKASVTHLGEPGEVVEVKKGYARNYLIPQGLASQATSANLRAIEFELDKLKAAAAEKKSEAQARADEMSQVALRFERKVSDATTGALYGSVSVLDLADGLTAAGFEVDRGEIHLEQPVKKLGSYDVSVTLAHGVQALVKFKVIGEEGEEAPVPVEIQAAPEDVADVIEAVEDAQTDDPAWEGGDGATGDDDEEAETKEEEIDLEDTV